MKGYQHILVTADLSEINLAALERGVSLVAETGSRLTLLHVIEHFPHSEPLTSVFEDNAQLVDQLIDNARKRLEKAMGAVGLQDGHGEIRLTIKSARHEIVRFATENGVDLIVVAPHGRGFVGSLGSTALGVVNGADCDVLVVRGAESG